MREGEGFEVVVGGGEGVGDGGGLAAGERADGVDEFAAGFEGGGDVFEECALDCGEFADVVERGGPAGVGIALPGADAAAGSVDEDAVEFGFGGETRAAVPRGGAEVENVSAGGAAFERFEAARVSIGRPDETLVLHEVGEVKGFAALAGTGVPPRLLRRGRGGDAHELRGEVLDFEGAGVEGGGEEKVLVAGVAESVRGEAAEVWSLGFGVWSFGFGVAGFGIRTRNSELGTRNGGWRRFAVAELLGEFFRCSRAGAEPEGGFALELLEERRGEIHLVAEPVGDGAGGEGFGFDGFRISREAVVELGGVGELFLEQFLGVQPLQPAVVDEHDAADGAFFARAEAAGEAEVAAQGGVGGKIGRRFPEDAGGVVEDRGFEHRSREKKHLCGEKGKAGGGEMEPRRNAKKREGRRTEGLRDYGTTGLRDHGPRTTGPRMGGLLERTRSFGRDDGALLGLGAFAGSAVGAPRLH